MEHAHDAISTADWLACARAVHFAACLLLAGVCVVERFVVAPVTRRDGANTGAVWLPIARWIVPLTLPAALVSGAVWLGAVTVEMSGLPPGEMLKSGALTIVLNQTEFGGLWKFRGLLWAGAVLTAIPLCASRRFGVVRSIFGWLLLAVAGALLASLAWAGHGVSRPQVQWHLPAEVLHLLVCGVWPAGLLPFGWLLARLPRLTTPAERRVMARLVSRFSALSLTGVALLTATGLANSYALLGPPQNLLRTAYGRTLTIKILLFVLMIGLGATNLLLLKPRIASKDQTAIRSANRLRTNISLEIVLTTLILIAVGVLGILPPSGE